MLASAAGRERIAPSLLCGLVLAAAGCGRAVPVGPIDLPKAPPRPGTAVVILVDTSGSMEESVPGKTGAREPKSKLAREALQQILTKTADWKQSHPDATLE